MVSAESVIPSSPLFLTLAMIHSFIHALGPQESICSSLGLHYCHHWFRPLPKCRNQCAVNVMDSRREWNLHSSASHTVIRRLPSHHITSHPPAWSVRRSNTRPALFSLPYLGNKLRSFTFPHSFPFLPFTNFPSQNIPHHSPSQSTNILVLPDTDLKSFLQSLPCIVTSQLSTRRLQLTALSLHFDSLHTQSS